MSTWVAALIAAAAITVTYFTCIRPMMRGRGRGCAMPGCGTGTASGEKGTSREIAELQDELRILRAHDALHGGAPPQSPDRSG